jgi:hypothetical protein
LFSPPWLWSRLILPLMMIDRFIAAAGSELTDQLEEEVGHIS